MTIDSNIPPRQTWKELTEPISSALNVIYKMAIGVGAMTTFAYLFLIEFFPSGLTPGDVIFFVFIALAFSFAYLLIIVFGTYSAVWILQALILMFRLTAFTPRQITGILFPSEAACPFSESRWQQYSRSFRLATTRMWLNKPSLRCSSLDGWPHALTSFIFFWWVLLIAINSGSSTVVKFLAACGVSGFLILTILEAHPSVFTTTKQKNARFPLIAFLPLAMISLYGGGPRPMLDLAFQGLGIQASNVSLELPDSEAGAIERVANIVGHPLVDCRRPQPSRLLVHGAEVLWTNVGEYSMVRFTSSKELRKSPFDPQPSAGYAILRFETKSMNVIRSHPLIDPCFDLPSDLLFDTGKYELDGAAKERIDTLARSISSLGLPEKVVVRGHSDPRRMTSSLDGKPIDNQILSERRAAAIKQQLDAQFEKISEKETLNTDNKKSVPRVPVIVHSEGYGSREPKVRCEKSKDVSLYELDQCNRLNRRVEIQVMYRRSQALSSGKES